MAGITFTQSVSQICVTIQHSIINDHGIQWILFLSTPSKWPPGYPRMEATMKLSTAPRSDSSPLLFSVFHAMTPVCLCTLPCLPGSAQSSMCASCVGHAALASLMHLLLLSIFLLALLCMRWVPFLARRLGALLPLFCHPDSIALILLLHLPPGLPTVL